MAVALIPAAGRGERLGSDGPKALVELAGRPLLQWGLDVLAGVPAIERIVVALPASGSTPAGAVVPLPAGIVAPEHVLGVVGGAVRSDSVRLALRAAGTGPAAELVLVHDAARPLLSRELVELVLAAVGPGGVAGAIAAAPLTDTVKRVDGEGLVHETLDRAQLWAVQTPQVFRREALWRALDVPLETLAQATDEAWLVERAGAGARGAGAAREPQDHDGARPARRGNAPGGQACCGPACLNLRSPRC